MKNIGRKQAAGGNEPGQPVSGFKSQPPSGRPVVRKNPAASLRAHIDQTFESGSARVPHLPSEASRLPQGYGGPWEIPSLIIPSVWRIIVRCRIPHSAFRAHFIPGHLRRPCWNLVTHVSMPDRALIPPSTDPASHTT